MYFSKKGSKNSAKKARGLEWENPGLFSDEDLSTIYDIELGEEFSKRLNREEKIFLELGSYMNNSLNVLSEIKDYLFFEGIVSQPGDLFSYILVDMNNLDDIIKKFKVLDNEQERWHTNAAAAQGNSKSDVYLTNEVVHDFGDGWKVVYVPALGEMKPYPGEPSTSHDRIVEGNRNGLCMGSHLKLYQDNREGRVYSVRTPSNKPAVTILINDEEIVEAKGKNNLPPDIEGAKRAIKWFKLLDLDYEDSEDVRAFPPITREEAIDRFSEDSSKAYADGWIPYWYRKGIPEIDEEIDTKIKEKSLALLSSGMHKKYKELVEPVYEHFARNYMNLSEKKKQGEISENELKSLKALEVSLFMGGDDVFKIYKKNPIFVEAAKKYIVSGNVMNALSDGILNYQEYNRDPEVQEAVFKNMFYNSNNYGNIINLSYRDAYMNAYEGARQTLNYLDKDIGLSFEQKRELASVSIRSLINCGRVILNNHSSLNHNDENLLSKVSHFIKKYNLDEEKDLLIKNLMEEGIAVYQLNNYLKVFDFIKGDDLDKIIRKQIEHYSELDSLSGILYIISISLINPKSVEKNIDVNTRREIAIKALSLNPKDFERNRIEASLLNKYYISLLDPEDLDNVSPYLAESWRSFYKFYNEKFPMSDEIQGEFLEETPDDKELEVKAFLSRKLIKLADILDSYGYEHSADLVDRIIFRV